MRGGRGRRRASRPYARAVLTLAAVVLAFTVLPSPWNAVAIVTAAAVDVAETVVFVRWSKRRRAAVGVEALVGRRAVVVTALAPAGRVKLDGELWEAHCELRAEPGEEVVVRAVDGLVLDVGRVG